MLAVVAVHDHLSVSWSQVSKKPTRLRWYYDIIMFFVWCKGCTNFALSLIFISSAFSACRTGVLSAHFLCRLHFGKSHKQIAHTSKREVSWIWNITKVSVGLQLDRSEWAFGFETFRWGWFWLSCYRKGDPSEGACLTNNYSVAEFWRAPPTSRPTWYSPAAMRTRLTPQTTSSSFQLL